jgi:hypothetical protein
MPLLYGEGRARAFRRLLEEIVKNSTIQVDRPLENPQTTSTLATEINIPLSQASIVSPYQDYSPDLVVCIDYLEQIEEGEDISVETQHSDPNLNSLAKIGLQNKSGSARGVFSYLYTQNSSSSTSTSVKLTRTSRRRGQFINPAESLKNNLDILYNLVTPNRMSEPHQGRHETSLPERQKSTCNFFSGKLLFMFYL